MSTDIFISHRHADRRLAGIFKRHLEYWEIPSDRVFQSSDYRSGVQLGEPLKKGLRTALGRANLLLLIVTDVQADLQWCLWEAGVATNPRDDTPGTKVVIVQTGPDGLRLFDDTAVIKITREDIRKFVFQFHRTEGFAIPQTAYKPSITDETLDKRSQDLFEELKQNVAPGKREERSRWDKIGLYLSRDDVSEILAEDETRRPETIRDKALVQKSFGSALLHFGYPFNTGELSLGDLTDRWQSSEYPGAPSGWIEELSGELIRALENWPAEPPAELMRSRERDDWFYPIVNHARIGPDGSFEFDLYLYRMPTAFTIDLREAQTIRLPKPENAHDG